jgi:hypothetical protein
MDQTQDMRKKEDIMKEEITIEDPSHSISSSITHRHHSPPYSTRKFYASEDSISNPKVSPVRHQRRRHELDGLQGEMRKLKPPSFDGEREREDDVEAWLLGIRKYF